MNRSEKNEAAVVYTEWEGNVKYTYYDDGIVKITRYRKRKKIYWGRILAAVVLFSLIVVGIYELFTAAYHALSDGGTQIQTNTSMPENVSETDSSADAEKTASSDENAYTQMNFTVCLDPGHGSYDSGTVGIDGIKESEINLEIASMVKEYLEESGVTVIMTRETDAMLTLSERCSIANQSYADFFVSFHQNSSDEESNASNGVELWVNNNQPSYDSTLALNILNALAEVGISQNLGVNYGYSGMPDQNYQVNTDTVMPSCLLELGFITSEEDVSLYNSNKNEYAKAIADAIVRTSIELGVINENGDRLINDQLISAEKTTVTSDLSDEEAVG